MDFTKPESTRSNAPGLQMEAKTGSVGRRRIIIGVLLLVAVIAVATGVTLIAWSPESSTGPSSLAPAAEPTPSVQPAISWSPDSIEIILSPGETASRSFTVASSVDLRDVVIEPVPTIAPFVTITPSKVSRLRANRAQNVSVTFAIPATATLETYTGTIHLRVGGQTFPQTLKMVLPIWNIFSSTLPDLPLTFRFPPEWIVEAVPVEKGGPYLLLKESGDEFGNATLTFGVFDGSTVEFIADITSSATVLKDVTDVVGSLTWRTVTRVETETGLEFKTSFTVISEKVYFVGSRDYSVLDPVRHTILNTLSITQ